MKKLLSCILTVCFVMSILVGNSLVKADDYSPFGAVEKTVIENVVYAKVELENGDISDYYMVDSFIDSKENIDKITEINIVDKIGDLPVTTINAYASATEGTNIPLDVTKITLPDTIKTICAYSFYNFKKLTNINLPDSLESIDDYAFCGMTSLKKVQLPKNITVIGKGLFLNCKSLEKVTFKGKITKIMDRAFSKCKALKKITLQNSLKTVGDEAFSNSGIEKVNILSSTAFGEGAFSYCNKLKKVTYKGKANVTLSKAMFFGAKKLKTVYIPKTVKKVTVSADAFYNCKALKTVKLASKKVKVTKDAFKKIPKTCKIYVKNARVKKAIKNSGFKGKVIIKKNMK